MNYKYFSLTIGFAIWLLATILFRIGGQYFFFTENTLILTLLYLVLIPFLGSVATWTFNKYKLGKSEAIQSASIMILPGMLLDTVCIQFFSSIFPNLPEKDGATFGSWLMFAYSVVLIFGLFRKDSK
ncbi:DUF5367 family protein [Sphingobacterium sp. SYP-B4668]|uniref:DUF5367 family protein n=1 Tax=Sphingobacterium sp. SYP-B4668 TaxID=2996035 RepID=UPI0022DE819F|nr:DUF5367 family protein [Sphingobacterium sp. SYP-B4668]